MSAKLSVYYICFKKSSRKIHMKLLMVATLGKQLSWCGKEERNIPSLCSIVLSCLFVLQQNHFSISCIILNSKNETLQKKTNEKWFKKEVAFIIQKSHCTNISRSVFYQTYTGESVNEHQIASQLSWWYYLIYFIFSVQVISNPRDLLLACLNLGKQWKDKITERKMHAEITYDCYSPQFFPSSFETLLKDWLGL